MSRLFDDAASEYLERDSAVISGVPFSMACWFYADEGTLNKEAMSVSNKDVSNHYHRLRIHSAENVRARSQQGGNDHQAISTTTFTLNTWNHACGVWTSRNNRAAFLNGGGKGTDTGDAVPANLDRTSIGRIGDSTPGEHMSGRIAEAAIWNVALTDSEVQALASGVSPLRVRVASLQAYWPLFAITGDAPDYSGGANTLTDNNTVGIADHAPVGPMFAFPSGWQGAFNAAAAAGGLNIPVAMHAYRQRHQSVV